MSSGLTHSKFVSFHRSSPGRPLLTSDWVLDDIWFGRSHRWVLSLLHLPNRRFFVRHRWARAKLAPSGSNSGALTAQRRANGDDYGR